MENYIVLHDVVKAIELGTRWPGLDKNELEDYLLSAMVSSSTSEPSKDEFPLAYHLRKERMDLQTGMVHYFCDEFIYVEPLLRSYISDPDLRGLETIVFKAKDIEGWETSRAWLKFVKVEDAPKINELNEARQKIEALEARIAELVVQLRSGITAAPADCDACRAEDQTIAARRLDIECAVRLTARFVEEGGKNKTLYHQREWKAFRDPASPCERVRREAFAAFRRALPEEYKEDDPSKK